MAWANEVQTLLSLDRYARIMGISPAHFNQAYAPSLNPAVFPLRNSCSDIFYQYDWQVANQISRETLARAIFNAESDLMSKVRYPLAPMWIAQEVHKYPRHYNNQVVGYGYNVRGNVKSIFLNSAKFIQGGRRATSLVGTATVAGGTLVYQDNDGDGLSENAQIILPTSLSDVCELKLYFSGKSASPMWEVRPATNKIISGGNVVINVPSWQLIDPDLFEFLPIDGGANATVDISTTANFVTSIEIHREFNDFTQPSVQFFWERGSLSQFICNSCSGSGCQQCTLIAQDGCIQARDNELGEIVPVPATFDATSETWQRAAWSQCKEPNQLKVWYKAGDISNDFLSSTSCNELSNYWAQTIAWLATARLNKSFCSCDTVNKRVEHLQEDLSQSGGETSFFVDIETVNNPFGPQRGSVQAWQRVSKLNKQIMEGFAV